MASTVPLNQSNGNLNFERRTEMKQKLLRTVALISVCGTLVSVMTGCIASIGGGKDRVTNVPPTRGQELMDLQKARDKGAITPEEYENQRKLILTR